MSDRIRNLAIALLLIPTWGCIAQTAESPKLNDRSQETIDLRACQQPAPSESLSSFKNPLPRWQTYLKQEGVESTVGSWVGDFNGDGKMDVATTEPAGSFPYAKLHVFFDVREPQPSRNISWQNSALWARPVKLRTASATWATKQLPDLQAVLCANQSVFVLGDRSPTIVFWHPEEQVFYQQQIISPAWQAQRRRAQSLVPGAFKLKIGRNKDRQNFQQAFVGDFDGDGKDELVVYDAKDTYNGGIIYRYLPGSTTPEKQTIDYGGIGGTVFRGKQFKVHRSLSTGIAGTETVKAPGEFLVLWTDKSAVHVVLDKGKWRVLWMAD